MSSESLDLIHKMYVAYYQRMADPEGLIYWEQQVYSFGWNTVSAAFSNAQESSDLYGNTTAESLVKKIYEAAFERAATDEEANWWAHESGHQKADLAFAIVNGAQGEDAATIDKKVTYSEYFVEVLDPDCDGEGPFAYSYSGSDDADRGREALSRITKDTDVSISNVSTDTSLLFESNNYDEGNGNIFDGVFAITGTCHSENENLQDIVRTELGNDYVVADWNDLKKGYLEYGAEYVNELFDKTDYTSLLVTKGGEGFYNDVRHYHASDHDGNKPSYFLDHDNIQDYDFSLGSWKNLNLPILAVKKTYSTLAHDEDLDDMFAI